MTKTKLACVALTIILAGCTWVKKTPEAEKVRLVPADRVMDCTDMGSVTTYTKDQISVVNRNAEKVAEELRTLAMNDAAERGADTIVEASSIVDGRQDFRLYKCLR
jgi:hypothetical protein